MNNKDWYITEEKTPLPNREVLARNTNKEFPSISASKQHQVKKFHGLLIESDIKETLLDAGLNEWCYL